MPDINELKDKITNFESPSLKSIITNKFVILILVGLLIFIYVGYSYGTYNPQSSIVTKLVDDQLKEKKLEFENIIKDKNELVEKLQKNLIDSQSKYMSSQKEIDRLKEELRNAKPPQNVQEARKRLLDLGYTTF